MRETWHGAGADPLGRRTLRGWIRANRAGIDEVIRRECPGIERISDKERRLWVLNWETLYNWARADGVKP